MLSVRSCPSTPQSLVSRSTKHTLVVATCERTIFYKTASLSGRRWHFCLWWVWLWRAVGVLPSGEKSELPHCSDAQNWVPGLMVLVIFLAFTAMKVKPLLWIFFLKSVKWRKKGTASLTGLALPFFPHTYQKYHSLTFPISICIHGCKSVVENNNKTHKDGFIFSQIEKGGT